MRESPGAVGEVRRGSQAAARLRQDRGEREPHDLPPYRAGAPDRPALVGRAARRPADLAARSLEHRVRRREHDLVRGHADQRDRERVDPGAQALPLRGIGHARFGEHDDALGARARVFRAEHRDAALADALERPDRLLELVGIDVAAGADDGVLDAAGDVDLALGDIAEVPGIDPLAVQQLARGFRVAVIAARGRGPAELDVPFLALGELPIGIVHHAYLVTG